MFISPKKTTCLAELNIRCGATLLDSRNGTQFALPARSTVVFIRDIGRRRLPTSWTRVGGAHWPAAHRVAVGRAQQRKVPVVLDPVADVVQPRGRRFAPDAPITRGEFCFLLWKAWRRAKGLR